MAVMKRMSFTSKAVLEGLARFESRVAKARRAGDSKQEAIWQEGIDAANAILVNNKKKTALARAARDMPDAARLMRLARGLRDYSKGDDAAILAGGPENFPELAEKLNRSPSAIRSRHNKLVRAAAALKR